MARPGRRSRVEEFSAAVSRHLHWIPWGTVWEGNFGWGGINPSPAPDREWKRFSVHRVAPTNLAPQRLLQCLQGAGLASDPRGNIWIPSNGNDRVCVFLKGDPNNSICFWGQIGNRTFRCPNSNRRNSLGDQHRQPDSK